MSMIVQRTLLPGAPDPLTSPAPPGTLATRPGRARPDTPAHDTPTHDHADIAFVRPTWRGWIHRIATIVFLPLSIVTIVLAPTAGMRIALAIYTVGVTVMLGTSAIYHSGRLGPDAVRWFKRIDHTTILLGIAGSYTAIAVLALPSGPATTLLVFTWTAAVIGAVVRMAWLRAPYPVVAAVYLAVGWGALLEWNALVAALSTGQLVLLIGGGLVYTAGAVVYALHRPNPWPATFAYHEVFHALVTTGVAAHYLLVLSLVLGAR